jgi:hypothetical protein
MWANGELYGTPGTERNRDGDRLEGRAETPRLVLRWHA